MPENTDRTDTGDSPVTRPTYSRRTALKRGAAIGGTLAWAVPVVSVISMNSANAENPSSPPHTPPQTPPETPPQSPPGNQTPPPGDTTVQPAGGPLLATGQTQATGGSGPQALAYTGFPTSQAVVGGAGLLAAGAALTVAANKRRAAAPEPVTDTDAG